MSKIKRSTIEVQGTPISILAQPGGDYISLTDMVRNFDGAGALIEQWLKNKDTVLFLGVWERINNPSFNSLEFEGIRNEAGRSRSFSTRSGRVPARSRREIEAKSGTPISTPETFKVLSEGQAKASGKGQPKDG
jgi:hypothetical protein